MSIFISRGRTVRIMDLEKTPLPKIINECINTKFTGRIECSTRINEEDIRCYIEFKDGVIVACAIEYMRTGNILRSDNAWNIILDKVLASASKGFCEIIELVPIQIEVDLTYSDAKLSEPIDTIPISISIKPEEKVSAPPPSIDKLVDLIKKVEVKPILCDPLFLVRLVSSSSLLLAKNYNSIVECISDILRCSSTRKGEVLYATCKTKEYELKLLVRDNKIISLSMMINDQITCDANVISERLAGSISGKVKGVVSIVPQELLQQ